MQTQTGLQRLHLSRDLKRQVQRLFGGGATDQRSLSFLDAVEEMLEFLSGRDDVVFWNGQQICDWFEQQALTGTPRT